MTESRESAGAFPELDDRFLEKGFFTGPVFAGSGRF
jgi:hypothetical protein